MVTKNSRRTGGVALAPLLLLGICGVSLAANQLKLLPGMTGVADVGAIDCATFSQMYPNGPTGMRQAVLTWAQGYFYAQSGKTTDEILAELPADNPWDFTTLSGHIVAYCEASPDARVYDAAADLWRALSAG